MRRPLCQPAQPEKDPRNDPRQPRRAFLFPPAQPANHCQRTKGNVKRFDLNQAAFFDHAKICQPNQRSDCRSTRSQTAARDRDKRDRHGQHAKHGRRARRPLVATSEELEGCGYQPVDEWRFTKVGRAAHPRNNVIAGLEHADRRQNPPSLFSFDLERTKRRQINRRPN